ncbi:hypothetical protein SAMN04515667_2137 [Formosa sp. Hel1_31_208]|uniref:hypothetical protein n=1 Tax=Formosa sp. Hel1_31_208 TaxID=1798225 RepID=UPI00087B58A3|nr:hypothetical protein [Formosa sp. Hel1_31_208]SDS42000.1 hypothetical protein SAMN04515667_2137 [Formosa sp. Hel1_31_208]
MKYYFVLFLCIVCMSSVSAQPDTEKKNSIKIPAVETKKPDTTSKKLIIKPNSNFGLTKTKKNIGGIPLESKTAITKPKKEFSMIDSNGLRNPGELFEERYNKVATEKGLKIETMADVFLGDISSNGTFVKIVCRDHEFPDGDLVRVLLNDQIIISSLLLTSGYKGFDIVLSPGINKIDFLALNQGDSGPNTAEFLVYDDDGNLVSSKKWNLLTGVKATVNVIKSTSEKEETNTEKEN